MTAAAFDVVPGAPRRVAVVRMLPGLGDLLCAVPALRALRAAWPAARVTLVGLPAAREVVSRFARYVDELVEAPGWPGLPERPPALVALPGFLAAMRRRRFDLALQLHGSGRRSNAFTLLLGARTTAGHDPPGEACPDPARFLPFDEDVPEPRRAVALLAHLGVPPCGEHLEFPVTAADDAALRALPEAGELRAGGYACVHPGSSERAGRWAPEAFAAVADGLAARGLRVVLTGSAAERELVARVRRAASAPALDLAGRTGLGPLAALLRAARLLVCNDTGVSHVAAALRVPSVFTRSNPRRWAPLDRGLHRPVGARVERPDGPPREATVADVLAAADDLLARERRCAPSAS